jgi:general nucleoside transport system permease protein
VGAAKGAGVIETILSLAFAGQVVRIAIPYALAALGGAITERSGVIDLALEAKLLWGAFAAAAVAYATDNAYLGVLGGVAAGAAVAAVQVYFSLILEADQVIVGVSLNVIAFAGTRFLLQVMYGEGANSPQSDATFGDAVLGNPLVWLAVAAGIAVPIAVRRLRWGLRLRAAGDRPDALVAVGVAPVQARLFAALVGGALAGGGGAQLSLAVRGFTADVSSGRGYIALAMVILSGWRPAWAVIACVGISIAEALRVQLQPQLVAVGLPHELIPLLPYVLTLAVLVIFGGNRRPPPAALGKP